MKFYKRPKNFGGCGQEWRAIGHRFSFKIAYDKSGNVYPYAVHEQHSCGRVFKSLRKAKKYCKLLDD